MAVGGDFEEFAGKYLGIPASMTKELADTIKDFTATIGSPIDGHWRGELDEQVAKLYDGASQLINGIVSSLSGLAHGDVGGVDEMTKILIDAEESNSEAMKAAGKQH